jgi:hypothetical protein
MKIYVSNLLVQINTSATSSYTPRYTNIAIYFISIEYTTTTMHTHKLLISFYVINNPIHPISQHDHLRNNLNSCRRRRNYRINRWHLLHHVLPLEELATSDLKHNIDYTQSRTQPRSKTKTWDTYQKVGALVEHTVKVLLCSCSVLVGEDVAIQALHPPYTWDSHCSIVRALKHGCYLRGDRVRERETKWMATFVWCPAKKFSTKTMRRRHH